MRWPVLLLAIVLVGCQSQPPKPGEAPRGDQTGELGSPIKRVSPGDVYVELGTAYLREGNLSEAFRNARKSVLIDPKLAAGHNLLGVLHQRLGQIDQAGEHFRRAVALEPHNPFALNALASFLCGQAQFEEADTYFARALQNPLYPTPWVAAYNRGRCAENNGALKVAETYYRLALRKQPAMPAALLRMAQLSFDQDNYLSARAYLQRYSAVAAHTAESLWLGIRTEMQLGDRDQVASYKIKLRANFPDSEQTRFLNEAESR